MYFRLVRSNRARAWICLVLAALALAACQSAPTPTPVPTVLPTEVPTSTPAPGISMGQVRAQLATSHNLDKFHIDKGLKCESCHTPFPPTGAPDLTVCLGCHGGKYSAVAAKTDKLNPNPHASHLGEQPCMSCHRVHEPFTYYCSNCHDNFRYQGRFAAATPTAAPK